MLRSADLVQKICGVGEGAQSLTIIDYVHLGVKHASLTYSQIVSFINLSQASHLVIKQLQELELSPKNVSDEAARTSEDSWCWRRGSNPHDQ